MKITDVKTLAVRGRMELAPWIFVQVYTDEGVVGTGDATNYPGGLVIEKAVHQLKPVVIGQDPFNIERIWQRMYRGLYYTGIAGAVIGAISGIEIALWDIVGKALGAPICDLLGGRCHERIRLYTHPAPVDRTSPELYAEEAERIVNNGYTALKFGPFEPHDPITFLAGHLNLSITREEERRAIQIVRAVRDAVGPDVEIAIDANGRFDVRTSIRLANELGEFDLLFFEEPVPPENVDAMAKVAAAVDVPICTGERLFTRHGFREILERQAADIIMPDVVRTGGIMETKKIAAMAETYYVSVAPHNPNSPISTLASAHVVTNIPNFLVLEMVDPERDAPWRDEVLTEPLHIEGGYLLPPTRPGLGVDLNLKAVAKYAYRG